MKISIQEIEELTEDEIIIRCRMVNDEILAIMHQIKNPQTGIVGIDGEKIHKLELKDIFYFETVDNKGFFYCRNQIYETKLKLYEFENITRGTCFFRASKSVILNADCIDFVKPGISGRFEANLDNGEKVIVSRQFVPDLKKILGL